MKLNWQAASVLLQASGVSETPSRKRARDR